MANVKILYQQNNTPCAAGQPSTIVLYVLPWRKCGTCRIGSKTHWTEFRTIFCPFRCGEAKSTNLSAFGMCPKLRPSTVLTYIAEIHFSEFDNLSQPHIFVCFSGLGPINLRNQSSYHVNISPSKSITDNPKDELRPFEILKEQSRSQSYR